MTAAPRMFDFLPNTSQIPTSLKSDPACTSKSDVRFRLCVI